MKRRTLLAGTAAVLAATALPAAVAAAHPALRPNEVPVGTTVDAEIVVPHGCAPGGGMPDDSGDASPTIEFSLQLLDEVTVTPVAVDGWETSSDDGVATWLDAGGAATDAIMLPVQVTVVPDGPVGEQLFLPAYQECENGESFRWVAIEGEDGWPAVRLTPLAADASPATSVPGDMATSHDMGDMASDDGGDVAPGEGMDDTEDRTTDAATEEASPLAEAAGQASEDESGGVAWWAWALAVLALGAGVAAWARSRGTA